jgi:hypothetical protein
MYFLIGSQWEPKPLPGSFTIDRCYIHGDDTHDIVTAIQGSASNYAVVDSYVAGIHAPGQDSQAFGAFYTTGPIKIVNNYLEAAGENVMFGGAGGNHNPGVPSDIEIRNNQLFKPLSWVAKTVPPLNYWVEKNGFELKSAQRVLFDGNTIENVWAAGQLGYAIVLTVRSSQSGDFAVVSDITITNNILRNVVSGFNTGATDDVCNPKAYPTCHNGGSSDRWYIANNLIQFYDPSLQGGNRNAGIAIAGGIDHWATPPGPGVPKNIVFQHNTMIAAPGKNCWFPVFFSSSGLKPPFNGLTNNIWLIDNVFCGQPSGDFGYSGSAALKAYMNVPSTPPYDENVRFRGNVMFVRPGEPIRSWPPRNLATQSEPKFDARDQLLMPDAKPLTTDGKQAGYSAASAHSSVSAVPSQ